MYIQLFRCWFFRSNLIINVDIHHAWDHNIAGGNSSWSSRNRRWWHLTYDYVPKSICQCLPVAFFLALYIETYFFFSLSLSLSIFSANWFYTTFYGREWVVLGWLAWNSLSALLGNLISTSGKRQQCAPYPRWPLTSSLTRTSQKNKNKKK